MQTKIQWALIGAGAALVVVFAVMTGFALAGANLAGYRFPNGSPSPQPVIIQTPGVGGPANPTPSSGGGIVIVPPPQVVPTPSPDPYLARFHEYSIPKPGGTPYAITVGPDGAVWFTEAECTSGIGRLAPNGTWQHWSITGNCESQPLAITRGPDGNLWFADVWSAYGRVTPAGVITRFPTPAPSYPTGITTGPDGSLWLAASSGNANPYIAKIGTDGKVLAEFQLPYGEQPRGIVTGPDGAIWFTENAGIGRLTVAGKLTEYRLPDGNGAGMPYQIAVGPDRNIWFVEYMPTGDGRVGRISTSGALTEFATPGLGGLQWITSGPDGAMWFTAAHSDALGRVSMAGSVTSYPIPSLRSQPVGIMVGTDGNIWFTEAPGDLTGKIGVFKV